jgi:hypothetical protein
LAGLINNLSSEDIALVASRLVGPPSLSSLDIQAIRSGREDIGKDERAAEVYATLALVQAVRELTAELHGAHAGHE